MKIFVAIVFAAVVMLAGGGNNPAPPAPPPKIKVGLIVSTTGALATFGTDTKNGVDLAVKEVNAAGGIDGQDIEIVFRDAASKPEEAGSAARRLVEEKVVACIGCVASGLTLNAAPVFQDAKIPLISPAATNPKVTEEGEMIFRACYLDDFQGEGCATYAWTDMKAKTAALISNQDDPYSTGLAGYFKAKFTELGGKVVSEQTFSYGSSDFEAPVKAIQAAAPDVVFAPVYYSDLLDITKQAKDMDYEPKLLGGDGWESRRLLEDEAVGVEGAVFANHFCAGHGEESEAFAAGYKKEYDAEATSLAALGYDTVYMLVSALAAAGSSDGEKIAKALGELKEFNGVTGQNIRMDGERNPQKPLVMVKIAEGEFAFVREVTYDEVRPPEKK